jgi:hypothetical protein
MTVPGELDALTADIFEALYRATTLLGIPRAVVGATARDLTPRGPGVRAARAARDVDCAIDGA